MGWKNAMMYPGWHKHFRKVRISHQPVCLLSWVLSLDPGSAERRLYGKYGLNDCMTFAHNGRTQADANIAITLLLLGGHSVNCGPGCFLLLSLLNPRSCWTPLVLKPSLPTFLQQLLWQPDSSEVSPARTTCQLPAQASLTVYEF